MARFIDAAGNVIDTLGQNQPSAIQNQFIAADSTSPVNSNATPVADFKYIDPTTFAVIVSRG